MQQRPDAGAARADAGLTQTPTQAHAGRRRALKGMAAGLLGAASSQALASPARVDADPAPALDIAPWSLRQGEPVLWHPYGQPSSHERDVVRRSVTLKAATPGAASSLAPLHKLYGTITPNGLVFERHHAGIPLIDPDAHRLALHGLVKSPRVFTMDDLLRFPSVSRIHFLECSGNTGREWNGPSGQPVQVTHGLLSCCEWTGVPLSTLLDEVGYDREAKWILAEGADGAAMSRSIPIRKALDDALIVYAQNGERLRPENGYPLRLFLPGFEGNMSIKWLRRLKLGREPFMTREETSKYTDLMPDGRADQFTFVMETKSVILQPSPGYRLRGAGFYEISGIAWSGRGRIRQVDVSTDGGRSWQRARLDGDPLNRALTRFRIGWQWDGGPARLQSRAVDETGEVQPTREQLVARRGVNSTYHYNGIQSWKVDPSGELSNA